jgi:signal peptidase
MPVGGLALVERASVEDLEIGDIATFRHPKRTDVLVSHRVTALTNRDGELLIETKGDANEKPDAWVIPEDRVVGKVRLTIPHLGYAADGLRQREKFYLLMGLPAAMLVLNEVANIARELRRIRSVRSQPEA